MSQVLPAAASSPHIAPVRSRPLTVVKWQLACVREIQGEFVAGRNSSPGLVRMAARAGDGRALSHRSVSPTDARPPRTNRVMGGGAGGGAVCTACCFGAGWYKDLGGRDKKMKLQLELRDSTGAYSPHAGSIPLSVTLAYMPDKHDPYSHAGAPVGCGA